MVNNQHRRQGAGHGVVQRLFARLDGLGLPGTPSLVGFSGGSDSTALAIAMGEARRAGRLRPWLAHVEHRVRPGSADDVSIVLAAAERLQLPVSIRAIPDGAVVSHSGVGPEEAMRRERYLLLADMADETGSTGVLTAHHADDQAETVLGHLIRGAGLEGAAGMAPSTAMTIPWWPSAQLARRLNVVRPLLGEGRRDLRGLVADLELAVVVDETNFDVERTRAALRHRALPILEAIHPDAALALARFADVAREAVERTSTTLITPCDDDGVDVVQLDGAFVGDHRLLIRTWVLERSGIALTFERTEAIRQWVTTGAAGRLEIGGGWSIRRTGRTITLHDDDERRPDRT